MDLLIIKGEIMKSYSKLFIGIFIIALVANCGAIQLTDTQEVASSILARRVGYVLAIRQPEMTKRLQPVAIAFIESGNVLSIDTFVSILVSDIDDPLLKADIVELIGLIQVESSYTPEELEAAKRIVRAFLQGVEIAGGRLYHE